MVRGSGLPRERGSAYLKVIVDNAEVQRRELPASTTTFVLGRSLECDLWIDDPMLSRKHCQLEQALEGDGWVVIDLNSRNGTHVNAKKIERSPLNHKDVITIGRAHVKFYAHGYVPPRPANPNEALLMPARTKAALNNRTPTPHHTDRPLPTPTPRKSNPADSTIPIPSPGETLAGDRTLPFTRPPAKPIVKPVDEE
jgi:pSer/pThr/pTyr-binding forkhead associated (FHA) protein